jgi:hypothetical protein
MKQLQATLVRGVGMKVSKGSWLMGPWFLISSGLAVG